MKTILLCLAIATSISMLGGCAFWKKKSGARIYEGDTSPNIRMHEEKPGYPVNAR